MSQQPDLYPKLKDKKYRGIVIAPFQSVQWISDMKSKVSVRPDDIWIVTYPKSGTTWTQQIVRLMKGGGTCDGTKINYAAPWVEAFNTLPDANYDYHVDIECMASPRAFKSHMPYDLMPCGPPEDSPGRYIYVARNPKDVATSLYFQYLGIKYFENYSWNKIFDMFMEGNVFFGNYFDHVLSWWAHRDDDNILFMKYEDMKQDLMASIQKIAEFIQCDISQDVLENVAKKTTFESMKEDPSVTSLTHDSRDPDAPPFYRKGLVGDWKNFFTEEQSKLIDSVYEDRMKKVGLEFEFEKCSLVN